MADETPVPIEGEYAVDARRRGCVVPDDVPPEARWAKQHLHSVRYDTPRWIWMKLEPLPFPPQPSKLFFLDFVYGKDKPHE